MAQIVTHIPDPKTEYSVENQRLINLALQQIIQKLNFSYQDDIKKEQQTFEWFLSWQYNTKMQDLIFVLFVVKPNL